MATVDRHRLKKLWDRYIHSSQHEANRLVHLEQWLLVGLKLNSTTDDQPHNAAVYSEMEGHCNTLARQFMTDIEHICKEGEDYGPLSNYLSRGRGWMLLKVIKCIGVKNLTNIKEFCDLLLTLFANCGDLPMVKTDVLPVVPCLESYLLCLSQPPKSSKTFQPQHTECPRSYSSHCGPYIVTTDIKDGDQWSDSDQEDDKDIKQRRSSRSIKKGKVTVQVAVRSLMKDQASLKILASQVSHDDDIDDIDDDTICDMGEIKEMSALDVSCMILSLLKDAIYSESRNKDYLSLNILDNLQDFLSELANQEADTALGWSRDHLMILQRFVVRTILVCCAVVGMKSKVLGPVTGAINMLLNFAQNKVASNKNPYFIEATDQSKQFVSESVLGILMMIQVVFEHLASSIDDALALLCIFIQHSGVTCIKEYALNSNLCRRTITTLFCLARTIQQKKSEYVHNISCLKKCHRTCDIPSYGEHHHDIMCPKNSGIVPVLSERDCVISFIIQTLLEAYEMLGTHDEDMLRIFFNGFRTVPLCCCILTNEMIRPLLCNMTSLNSNMRASCMSLVTRIILKRSSQMSGDLCKVCCSVEQKNVISYQGESTTDQSDSALSGDDSQQDKQKQTTKWVCLKQLHDVIMTSDDFALRALVARHLPCLVGRGDWHLRHYLLVHIILPVLLDKDHLCQGSSTMTSQRHRNSACKVSQYCIISLPTVLQTYKTQQYFLNRNGERLLERYLQYSTMRSSVLRVFRVLIQDYKSNKEIRKPRQKDKVIKILLDIVFDRKFSYVHNASNTSQEVASEMAAYIWLTCEKLFHSSEQFRISFLEGNGFWEMNDRLMPLLKSFQSSDDDGKSSVNQKLMAVESLLRLVLATISLLRKPIDLKMTTEDVIDEVKFLLEGISKHDTPQANALLETLLQCSREPEVCLFENPAGNLCIVHLRGDSVDGYNSDSPIDSEDNIITEHGYEADSECHSDNSESCKSVTEQKPDIILYPELCHMVLDVVCSGSTWRAGMEVVISKLIDLTEGHPENVAILQKQGISTILLKKLQDLIKNRSTSQPDLKLISLTLDLVRLLAKYQMLATELRLYLRLFQEANPPTDLLLSTLCALSKNERQQSTYSLQFPVLNQSLTIRSMNQPDIADNSTYMYNRNSVWTRDSHETGFYESAGYLGGGGHSMLQSIVSINPNLPEAETSIKIQEPSSSMSAPLKLAIHHDKIKQFCISKHGYSSSLWLQVNNEKITSHIKRKMRKTRGFLDSQDSLTRSLKNLKMIEDTIEKTIPDDSLHVMSLGNHELMTQLWLHVETGSLAFRLCKANSPINRTTIHLSDALSPNEWQHVAITFNPNYVEHNTQKPEIIITINGSSRVRYVIDYKVESGLFKRLSRPKMSSYLYLGDATQGAKIKLTYDMGSMFIFKDAVLEKEAALFLYALGPNAKTISDCESIKYHQDLGHLITSDLLKDSGIDFDFLTGVRSIDTQALKESLLLIYSPEDIMKYSIYTTDYKESSLPRILSSRDLKASSRLLKQFPEVAACDIVTLPTIHCNYGLDSAIHETGGIGVFLFLYAKVVETNKEEMTQATALSLLLGLIRVNQVHSGDFKELFGYRLLCRVFTSDQCVVGLHCVKVLLDACLSESIIVYDKMTKTHTLIARNNAVLQNIHIVSDVLLSWKVWDKCDVNVWQVALQALESLIQDDHPSKQFNRLQFKCAKVVNKLLLTCQERIQEGYPSLPLPVAKCVLNIIRCMMGSPFDPNLIVAICDCLILLHPAAMTFVNHTEDSLYYFQKWAFDASKDQQRALFVRAIKQTSTPVELTPQSSLDTSDQYTRVVSPTKRKLDYPDTDIAAKFRPRSQSYPFATDNVKQLDGKTDLGQEQNSEIGMEAENVAEIKSDPSEYTEDKQILTPVENNHNGVIGVKGQGQSQCDNRTAILSNSDYSESDGVTDLRVVMETQSDQYSDIDNEDNLPVRSNSVDEIEEDEKGIVYISAGFLDLMCKVIVKLPDSLIKNVLGNILNPSVLVVFAHHNAHVVRLSVLKLLDIYFHRVGPEETDLFLKMQGFHLLACQIYHHTSTRELVEAAFTMLFGQPHSLDQDCDPQYLIYASPLQHSSVVTILALVEGTVHDTTLCHYTLCLLLQVFENVPAMATTLMDNGLVETMCNVLVAVIKVYYSRLAEYRDDDVVLVEDISCMLSAVAVRCLGTSGITSYQQYEDMLTLLRLLELKQADKYGSDSYAVSRVQSVQCHVLKESLYAVKDISLDALQSVKSSNQLLLSQKSDIDDENIVPETAKVNPSVNGVKAIDSSRRTSSYALNSEPLKSAGHRVPSSELLKRTKSIISWAVDFARLSCDTTAPSIDRKSFNMCLLQYLTSAINTYLTKSPGKDTEWEKIVRAMWDSVRKAFSTLFIYVISPLHSMSDRHDALVYVAQQMRYKEILQYTLLSGPQDERLLSCVEAIRTDQTTLSDRGCIDLVVFALSSHSSIQNSPVKDSSSKFQDTLSSLKQELKLEREIWNQKKRAAKDRILSKLDRLMRDVQNSAMKVTQAVVNTQGAERRKFIEHVKENMSLGLQVKKQWQHIIQQYTHERAVWFCEESYPPSYQLDPTEGPCRVRKRLQRCHLSLDDRYIKPHFRHTLEAEKHEPPLTYLFHEDSQNSDSAALIYKLHTNERIQYTCHCTSVTPSSETSGEILLGEQNVYFVGDEALLDANHTQILLGNHDVLSMTWPHEEIKEIQIRRYQLCDKALEIFLTNGKTCLLAFGTIKDRDTMYRYLDDLDLPNRVKNMENAVHIQNLWVEGKLTNFEYLTYLNQLAGRSFNDLMQYPVFPFILRDYVSNCIDLNSPTIYRDLNKPIAVQEKAREDKYIQNYDYLKAQYSREGDEGGMLSMAPFHYGSHYSNSGTVLHFLVRLPPYTQMFLTYQDRNFDVPDRTFHSVGTTWKLSSFESTTDVKELIPEFFFLPEFLINFEGFDFGMRQTGESVDNVNLPPWCHGDPRLFVLIMRQALESDHVTKNIPGWIDLIFGYKQTGRHAIDAINVFHPATYSGIDVDSISDPLKRRATRTMIKTYGQTPVQQFQHSHPASQLTSEGSTVVSLVTSLLNAGDKPNTSVKLSPLDTVMGIKWGNYVGSPCGPRLEKTWQTTCEVTLTSIVVLPTGDVFGLKPNTCLMPMYSKEISMIPGQSHVMWAGILSWGHPDGIIRLKNKREQPPANFILWNSLEQVTCCVTSPDCKHIFFGSTSGLITLYRTKHNTKKVCDMEVEGHKICLYGHTASITNMYVCKPFSIMVSASQDGTCIVWDLNRLSYVCSIDCKVRRSIDTLTVSHTLGDIAFSTTTDKMSKLYLYTVNGKAVSSIVCQEGISSLEYSRVPEGRAVNVIAGGLNNGVIRLWSSWDLMHVQDIHTEYYSPVIAVTFSHDCLRLFGVVKQKSSKHDSQRHLGAESIILMWERLTGNRTRQPNFVIYE